MSKRRVTKIHLTGGEWHEHIEKMIWNDPETPDKHFESTREQMVNFVNNNPNGSAYVYDVPTQKRVSIGAVNATPPYVRTYADGEWQDNLLSLEGY